MENPFIKPRAVLHQQLLAAEQERGKPFFANDYERRRALAMDMDELKKRYPELWEEYLALLRRQKKEDALDARKYIRMVESLRAYIASYATEDPQGRLRKHQRDVFKDLQWFIEKGRGRGYIEMPTGTGKTAIFVELVKATIGNREGRVPLKALVLVPSQPILAQTVGRPAKGDTAEDTALRGFAKFAPNLRATAYYEREKDLTGDAVVMTYQSFLNRMEQQPDEIKNYDLIICDEAHHTTGEETEKSLSLIPPHIPVIGLTATSEYSRDKKVEQILPELIHELDLKESIQRWLLANVIGYYVGSNVIIEDEEGEEEDDFIDGLNGLIHDHDRNGVGAEFARRLAEEGRGVLISCCPGDNMAHAYEMADLCRKLVIRDPRTGVERTMKAEAVSGDTKLDERREIFKRFEQGEIDVLTYVDVLKEGWDSQRAKGLVNMRPTRSIVFAIQRLGRVLRLDDEWEDAKVVEMMVRVKNRKKQPIYVNEIFGKYRPRQGERLVWRPARASQNSGEEVDIGATEAIEDEAMKREVRMEDGRVWLSAIFLRDRFGVDDYRAGKNDAVVKNFDGRRYVPVDIALDGVVRQIFQVGKEKGKQWDRMREVRDAIMDAYSGELPQQIIAYTYQKVVKEMLTSFSLDRRDGVVRKAVQRWMAGNDRPPYVERLERLAEEDDELLDDLFDKILRVSPTSFASVYSQLPERFWGWFRGLSVEYRGTLYAALFQVIKEPFRKKAIEEGVYPASLVARDYEKLTEAEKRSLLERIDALRDDEAAGLVISVLEDGLAIPEALLIAQKRWLWDSVWDAAAIYLRHPDYEAWWKEIFEGIKKHPAQTHKAKKWVKDVVRGMVLRQDQSAFDYAEQAGFFAEWILDRSFVFGLTTDQFELLGTMMDDLKELNPQAPAVIAAVGSSRHKITFFDDKLGEYFAGDSTEPDLLIGLQIALKWLEKDGVIGLLKKNGRLGQLEPMWEWMGENMDKLTKEDFEWAMKNRLLVKLTKGVHLRLLGGKNGTIPKTPIPIFLVGKYIRIDNEDGLPEELKKEAKDAKKQNKDSIVLKTDMYLKISAITDKKEENKWSVSAKCVAPQPTVVAP